MQFLTMKFPVFIALIYTVAALEEYKVPDGIKFSAAEVHITKKGRSYIDGIVLERDDQSFIQDLELLKPLHENMTVYFELEFDKEAPWKGGGGALCVHEDSLLASTAKIMRGFLNVEQEGCPITELPEGDTKVELSLWNLYLPVRKMKYDFSFRLSLVDEKGNRLVFVSGNGRS